MDGRLKNIDFEIDEIMRKKKLSKSEKKRLLFLRSAKNMIHAGLATPEKLALAMKLTFKKLDKVEKLEKISKDKVERNKLFKGDKGWYGTKAKLNNQLALIRFLMPLKVVPVV